MQIRAQQEGIFSILLQPSTCPRCTTRIDNLQCFKLEIKSSGHFYAETLIFYLRPDTKQQKMLLNWAENQQKKLQNHKNVNWKISLKLPSIKTSFCPLINELIPFQLASLHFKNVIEFATLHVTDDSLFEGISHRIAFESRSSAREHQNCYLKQLQMLSIIISL